MQVSSLASPEAYVAWLRRHALAVIVAHLLVAALSAYLIAFHLPLRADFSYLLPQDAPAVVDLRRLEARVPATDTLLVVVQAPDPAARARAQATLLAALRAIDHALVESIDDDDPDTRAYAKAHRFLLVDTADLEAIARALGEHIRAAKLRANPLYIDLGEREDTTQLDALRAKRTRLAATLDRPRNVSADGRTAMLQVHTAFRPTDAGKGAQLMAALEAARAAAAAPGVAIGFAGGVVNAVAEHDAIFNGMVLSSAITTLLVALVLALYFRSARLLALLIGTLAIATASAFGAAALTVGHLNAATAFLGAVIAGNGINYGILLIARLVEEQRAGHVDDALVRAIAGTLRPTIVASLGASIAYGSLAATSFKGFADFAIIGAVGMTLCWTATYLLLPALVLRFGRQARAPRGEPVIGAVLVRVLGFRRPGVVCAVAAAIAIGATVIVVRYIAADPFEYDIRQLRSEGDDAVTARTWMKIADTNFGRGYAGRTIIAADRLAQVPLIVDALRARDRGLPPAQQTIGSIESLLTVVPADQDRRIALLGEIRAALSDDNLDAVEDKERAELLDLRPPAVVDKVAIADLPPRLREHLTEKDGRIGLLISIRPANLLDEWDGHDLIRFANAVRTLALGDGETITTSGASVVFADILASIERDGPIVTGIAALGLAAMVLLLVGRNRRAVAVLVATAAGALLMVAACALLGLKVNFLNFVALPITLGLGVDYAINIAHRHASEDDPRVTLRTSGSAVFVCSLTTIIGYGSLLVSNNLAIRGYGAASLIGEVTCLLAALVLVPALLAVGQSRRLPSADHR